MWLGYYSYPNMEEGPVPFNVMMIDQGGDLSGEIDEPNTFSMSVMNVLFSKLTGHRNGDDVFFIKNYENACDFTGHSVHYRGQLNEDETEITGTWDVPGPMGWSGGFIMSRDTGNKIATAQEGQEEVWDNQKLPLELVGGNIKRF